MGNKTFPTLYKKNKNGSIQQWTINVCETADGGADIVKVFGQKDGKLQQSDPDSVKGKNIGKANETTPYEQAIKEAEAQWTKKKTGGKGYVESLDDAEAGKKDELVLGGADPMLAHTYATVLDGVPDETSKAKKIEWPALVQPKLDGHRCIATVVDGSCTLWSRTRKPIVSMPHVVAELERLCAVNGTLNVTFDGELYNHAYHDKFEEISSLIKPEYVKEDHELVEYHIYDIVIGELSQNKRNKALAQMMQQANNKIIVPVSTKEVPRAEAMYSLLHEIVDSGYEGLIIRNKNGLYEGRRSNDLQKVKEFFEDEYEIVGIEEGRGKMKGKAVFNCVTPDGAYFAVKMDGDLDRLAEIWNDDHDKYIGKPLTVKYQGLTAYGVPRFPVGKAIRDYE